MLEEAEAQSQTQSHRPSHGCTRGTCLGGSVTDAISGGYSFSGPKNILIANAQNFLTIFWTWENGWKGRRVGIKKIEFSIFSHSISYRIP